ncbi:MAG: 2-oxoglutarate oxidoreductase [Melioribacteraceae bacterium]|nr:2-oxoglutarate oxidoreductase [Melioribacteraceae bacterium]
MEAVNAEENICVPENLIYQRPETLLDVPMHYCPGCAHGTVHKLIAEVIDELDIQGKTIGVAPVGCSVFAYQYLGVDFSEAAHGRASAVATGIKRVMPDKYVFSYQGDGDLAAIGTAETIHTCNRGENLLIIFINNGIYGMTGGQMAPTTLPNMKSTTSPYGRDVQTMGNPLVMTDLIKQLPSVYYITRQAVNTAGNVRKAKKAIKKGFQYQDLNKGTSFVEIVANCPSNWKMTPLQSNKFLEDQMFPYYPLGDIKVPEKEVK